MLQFSQTHIVARLEECDAAALDRLSFGVIAMTPDGKVTHYNAAEAGISGVNRETVLGKHFFSEVAPCTNNFLVAQRYLDEPRLDATISFVFTLKMLPRKVELRLLKEPAARFMYLLVRSL